MAITSDSRLVVGNSPMPFKALTTIQLVATLASFQVTALASQAIAASYQVAVEAFRNQER